MNRQLSLLYGLFAAFLLIVLSACGGATDTADTADTDTTSEEAADSGAAEEEGSAAMSVNDPWVRAMTAGEMGDEMGDEMDGEMDMGSEEGGEMEHAMGSGSNSAAYMMLVNAGSSPDALISAATDVAQTVELHTVIMTDDGVMQMRPVEQIDVPANGETELRPGGFHVMLLDITQDLEEGQEVDLTLTFENAGEVQVTAPVQQAPPMNMDEMDGDEMDEMEGEETDTDTEGTGY